MCGSWCFGYILGNVPLFHKGKSGYGGCTQGKQIINDIKKNKEFVSIVTGSNSGIGTNTAINLARTGATVIIPCRSMAKSMKTIQLIAQTLVEEGLSIDDTLVPMVLDLSDLNSVRNFVKEFKTKFPYLNLLINNAGVMAIPTRESTTQGQEMQMGVNHLGHFLLTSLLTEHLIEGFNKSNNKSRVVCLTSSAHWMGTKEFINVKLEGPYNAWTTQGQSKLANIMHAREFNERQSSKGVLAFSVHPGVINTNLQAQIDYIVAFIFALRSPFMCKTIEQGSSTSLQCGLSPQAEETAGKQHSSCNSKATSKDDLVNDSDLRGKLWDYSEALMNKGN